MSRTKPSRQLPFGPSRRRLAVLAVAALAGSIAPAAQAVPPAATPPQGTTAQAPAGPAAPVDPIADAIGTARATGKAVAIPSQTTESSTLVANPDGTLTRTDGSTPQRAWRDGGWHPIDTSLQQVDGGYAPRSTTTALRFSAGGGHELVTLNDGAHALTFSWPWRLPAATVSGDTVTYPEVRPGVDLQLTADAAGYSSILVIKSAKAAANPDLKKLDLGLSATRLSVKGTAADGTEATDPATGRVVFHSDTALMWDSTPAADSAAPLAAAKSTAPQAEHVAAARVGAHRARVKVAIGHGRQSLTLDRGMLVAASTRYPVYVDPEWSGSPGKSQLNWARISDNGWNVYNSTSRTGSTNARAGYDNWPGGGGEKARTYYQMNTAGIKGAKIFSAHLYVSTFWAASCYNTNAAAYGTSTPAGWSSSKLYWNHEPSRTALIDTAASEELTCGTDGAHVSPPTLDFNVSSRIITAAAGNWASASFVVEAQNMDDKYAWKQLGYGGGATMSVTYSYKPKLKDGTGDPSMHPSIVDQGKTLTTTPTPTLSARGVDPDLAGGSETLRLEYQVFNAAGTMVASGYGPKSGYNANGSDWTTPTLDDGAYTWKAAVENSAGLWGGVWTPTTTFTVDTKAPHAPAIASTQFPPNQIGGAFGDKGLFALENDRTNNVTGYLFSLDGSLANVSYSTNHGTAWTATTVPKPGMVYYAKADNANGTGTVTVNGSAGVSFAPGSSGAHTLYAKAVDQAGSSSPQTSYLFYAGTSTPTFAYGDNLVKGWTATNADGSTVAVPAGTAVTAGHLVSQQNYKGYYLADGFQAMLSNNGTAKVAVGDTATLSFDVPKTGPWDVGADLVTGVDYGTFRLVLDASGDKPITLIDGFDAYTAHTDTHYLDFGVPKDAGGLQTLRQGVHTITITITGKNAASTGLQASIDVLRIAPTATCAINDTTTCLNNTAISTYTAGGSSSVTKADADGQGWSFNAADLAAAGWTAGKTVVVDGARITLPSAMGNGTNDNMLASGQVITVPAQDVVNRGNALVFAGFSVDGFAKNLSGTITYADDGSCPQTQQDYSIDAVTDWAQGAQPGTVLTVPHRNFSNGVQYTGVSVSVFAVSVPLVCSATPVTAVTLPLQSNGVQANQPSAHLLGLGIRPTSITGDTHWVGSWGAAQDTGHVQAKPAGGSSADATLTDQTIRIPAHLSLGTDEQGKVRIHVANSNGLVPVTVDAASVALQDPTAGGATAAAAPVPVTFGGSASVTMLGGGDLFSDPVALPAAQQATVLVSLKLHGTVTALPGHLDSRIPVYITAAGSGDHTMDTGAAAFTTSPLTGVPMLAGVDVSTPADLPTGALALYGDQTVNSDTAAGDGVSQLSDDIAAAFVNDPNGDGTVPYGILNVGGSMNTNHGQMPTVLNSPTPRNASGSIDRNVLNHDNVRTVLVSYGTGDLLQCMATDANACAAPIEDKLTRVSAQLRSYYTDDSTNLNVSIANESGSLTVYVATIPPFTGAHTDVQEQARLLLNAFILDAADQRYLNGFADGAIDFAAAVSADGTDTSPAVKDADLTGGAPNNQYYQDLGQRYVQDSEPSDGTVNVQPNFVGSIVPMQ